MSTAKNNFHVSILGSTQAGKTCFLAGLEILNEANRDSEIQIRAKGRSLKYLQEQGAILRRQGWPAGTNVTEKIKFDISINSILLNVFLLDYPGGDFEKFLSAGELEDVRDLAENLQQADVLLLLMDPLLDIQCYKDSSPESAEALMKRQSAHLGCIMDEFSRRSNVKTPIWEPRGHLRIGLVLTKCDKMPELFDSKKRDSFLEENAGNLLRKLRDRSKELKTFAISAVGSVEQIQTPEGLESIPSRKLEPQRYEELFGWVARLKIKRNRWQGIWKAASVACGLLMVAFLLGMVNLARYSAYKNDMDGDRLSLPEKIQKDEPGLLFGSTSIIRVQKVDEYLAKVASDHGDAKDSEWLIAKKKEMLGLRSFVPASRLDAFDKGYLALMDTLDESLWKVASATELNSEKEIAACNQYLSEVPSGKHTGQIQSKISENKDYKMALKKREIGQIIVTTTQNLNSKAIAAENFLGEYSEKIATDGKSQLVKEAVALAKRMVQGGDWTIYPKELDAFPDAYHIIVETYVGNGMVKSQKSILPGTKFQWPDSSTFVSNWRSGQPVKVLVWYDSTWWKDFEIAVVESDAPDAILLFLNDKKFFPLNGYDTGNITRKYRVKEIPQQTFQAYQEFINPGTYWTK